MTASRLNFLWRIQRLKTNCPQIEIISIGSQMSTASFRIGFLFKLGISFMMSSSYKNKPHIKHVERGLRAAGELSAACYSFMLFMSITVTITTVTVIINHLLTIKDSRV